MLIRHHINRMIRPTARAMSLVDGVGFSHPILRDGAHQRRDLAFAGLFTTAALVVSLAIAMIAVSIGIARAHAATNTLDTYLGGDRTEVSCVQ